MRAALHLRRPSSSTSPSPAKPAGRHRFVQDGEVPVVVVNPRHQRPEEERATLGTLERALASEREARQAAERALQQVTETIRQLQTRLAHTEIAQREAVPAPAPQVPEVARACPPKAKSRTRRAAKDRPKVSAKDKPVEW